MKESNNNCSAPIKTKYNFWIPKYPLPEDISAMPVDEKVCHYCGVSYLIYHEIQYLMDQVEQLQSCLKEAKYSEEEKVKLCECKEPSLQVDMKVRVIRDITSAIGKFSDAIRTSLTELRRASLNMKKELNTTVTDMKTKFQDIVNNLHKHCEENDAYFQKEKGKYEKNFSQLREHLEEMKEDYSRILEKLNKEKEYRRLTENQLDKLNEDCFQLRAKFASQNMDLSETCRKTQEVLDAKEKSMQRDNEELAEKLAISLKNKMEIARKLSTLQQEYSYVLKEKELAEQENYTWQQRAEEQTKQRRQAESMFYEVNSTITNREREFRTEYTKQMERLKNNFAMKEKAMQEEISNLKIRLETTILEAERKQAISENILKQSLRRADKEIKLLEETVRTECVERQGLTDALNDARNLPQDEDHIPQFISGFLQQHVDPMTLIPENTCNQGCTGDHVQRPKSQLERKNSIFPYENYEKAHVASNKKLFNPDKRLQNQNSQENLLCLPAIRPITKPAAKKPSKSEPSVNLVISGKSLTETDMKITPIRVNMFDKRRTSCKPNPAWLNSTNYKF